MKLLFIIKSLSLPGGGAERVLADLTAMLVARGHEIIVATFDRPGAKTFYPFDPAIQLVHLGIGDVAASSRPSEVSRRVRALRRFTRQLRPDVAIGFMHSAFVPLAVALAGTGTPVIASEHIVYGHYDRKPVQRLLLRAVAPLLAGATAISERMRAGFPDALASRMTVIPNAVTFKPGVRADVEGGPAKTLLSVGRLEHQKDHLTLVEAFSRLAESFPDWRLRIVGEGVLRPRLEERARTLGVDGRIGLPGVIEDIGAEYARAQIFASSSRYESFGLSTAEALAYGLPVVGFADCPGTNELIEDGVNGVLVKASDRAAALAAGLGKLMSSPGLRADLGAAGPASVERFAPGKIADLWEALFKAVAARGEGR